MHKKPKTSKSKRISQYLYGGCGAFVLLGAGLVATSATVVSNYTQNARPENSLNDWCKAMWGNVPEVIQDQIAYQKMITDIRRENPLFAPAWMPHSRDLFKGIPAEQDRINCTVDDNGEQTSKASFDRDGLWVTSAFSFAADGHVISWNLEFEKKLKYNTFQKMASAQFVGGKSDNLQPISVSNGLSLSNTVDQTHPHLVAGLDKVQDVLSQPDAIIKLVGQSERMDRKGRYYLNFFFQKHNVDRREYKQFNIIYRWYNGREFNRQQGWSLSGLNFEQTHSGVALERKLLQQVMFEGNKENATYNVNAWIANALKQNNAEYQRAQAKSAPTARSQPYNPNL